MLASQVHNPLAALLLFVFIILPFFWLVFGSMAGAFDKPKPPRVKREINMPLRDMRDGTIVRKGRG